MASNADKYLNEALAELDRRAKFTLDMFEVSVENDGKLVSVTRKSDGAVHQYERTTPWPRAREFMNSLTDAQLNDVFPNDRKKKK